VQHRKEPPIVASLDWGRRGIGPGGLRIFRYLEEKLPRGPQPHLMTRELADAFGLTADPDAGLATIARSESAVRELADWLAFGSDVRHLEQEALEPRSPQRMTSPGFSQFVSNAAGPDVTVTPAPFDIGASNL
jgi:Uncharacterized protein conserved in bacteria C-term(DUF2220)